MTDTDGATGNPGGAVGRLGSLAAQLRIPRAVLRKTALLSVFILGPVAVVAVLVGHDAALGVAMGVLGCIGPAMKLQARYAALLAIPVALTGAVALGVAGMPTTAAAFAALACLLTVQGNLVVNGLLAGVPTIAAVFTCLPGRPGTTIMIWMLVGGWLTVAVLSKAPRRQRLEPVAQSTAWLHASAMAALVAPTVYLVNLEKVPHGYWVPMTVATVLRPYGTETINRARQRVAGTLAGTAMAALLVILLPPKVALLLAMALMVLMLAYALLGRYAEQVMCMTPFVILIGAGGMAAQALGLALERAGFTVIAVLLASGVSLLLTRYEARTRPSVPAGQADPLPG